MLNANWMAKIAKQLGYKAVKKTALAGAAAVMAGSMMFSGSAHAQLQTVASDDFEGLTMVPFTAASGSIDLGAGGAVWTRDIRSGTNREWTLDNSGMGDTTGAPAYDGWAAWNVDAWIVQQGTQLGRGTNIATGGNTALVADPDAWDDFNAGGQNQTYNSFYSREYDTTGFDESTMVISFDYEFASYDAQRGTIEVSFDNGTTWQTLVDEDSSVLGNSMLTGGNFTFNAGIDFTPSGSNMIFRVGCLNADNDWWFAVDNISVTTGDGFSDVEDFEGLTLDPFTVMIGDGTDFAETVPNWVLDNSGTVDSNGFQGFSAETAYDGWHAMDVASWVDEQGVQAGRTLFNIIDPNNTVLVADGDAFYDYEFTIDGDGNIVEGFEGNSMNTYISRTYDVSGFDNCTLVVSFEYEFAVENQQVGNAEISFDGGATWQEFARFDNDGGNTANNTVLAGQAIGTAGVEFNARQSNNVTVRFGYLQAGNNWWYAIDNVTVQAESINYVKGDANGDGNFNTLDVTPFVTAVLAQAFDPAIDMNCDGQVNSLDIATFIDVLLNGS